MGAVRDKLRLCGAVITASEASETCGSCGGSDVRLRVAQGVRHDPLETADGILTIYEAEFVCEECGAICNLTRIWRLPTVREKEGY